MYLLSPIHRAVTVTRCRFAVFSLFFVIMGRVYSLTILMNFYQRHKQQLFASTSVHVTGASGPGSGSQFVVESFGFLRAFFRAVFVL